MKIDKAGKLISKIGSDNCVTIPKQVRDHINLQNNDTIEWHLEPNGIVAIARKSSDLWQTVNKQASKFGNLSTPEVEWDDDVENNDF